MAKKVLLMGTTFPVALEIGARLRLLRYVLEIQLTGFQTAATTTELGVVIDQAKVEALPLNGRNYQQLVGSQASVANAPASSTGGRGGMKFNGSPALGNNLLLDGVDMKGFIGQVLARMRVLR